MATTPVSETHGALPGIRPVFFGRFCLGAAFYSLFVSDEISLYLLFSSGYPTVHYHGNSGLPNLVIASLYVDHEVIMSLDAVNDTLYIRYICGE